MSDKTTTAERKKIISPSFIAMGLNEWNGVWMNRQQLMSRVGQTYPVIYSNGGWFSWERKKALKCSTFSGEFIPSDNVVVDRSPTSLLRIPRIPFIDNIVLSLLGKRLNRALRRMNSSGTRILYIFHPSFVDYIDRIEHDILVYHCYDNFAQMHGSDSIKLLEEEAKLCSCADFIFTSSEGTRERFDSIYNRSDSIFLPNGVDFKLFDAASHNKPSFLKLEAIPEKKVGYVGSINDKLDISLIDELTERMKDVAFVFVGRVNNLPQNLSLIWERIITKPNVAYFPPCSQKEVPCVLKSMDVNAIYYDLNDSGFAKDGYPLKLHECLASGKPLVSSNLRAVREFSDSVLIAESIDDWEKKIRQAINTPDAAPASESVRIKVASENSWDQRVLSIFKHLKL